MRSDRIQSPTVPTLLPPYLVEKRKKVKEVTELTNKVQYHNLEVEMMKIKGFAGYLRHSSEVLEGSVLALGVSTTYDLISSLVDVREGLEKTFEAWRVMSFARKEEAKHHEELYNSFLGAYSVLRDKNESTEKELKQLIKDRDRKDAALDEAIQYVHAVIAERASWQEVHGHNIQELPTMDAGGTFSEQCTSALNALYAARRVDHCTDPDGYGIASEADVLPGQRQRVPIGRPFISIVDNPATLTARWKSIENTRASAAYASTRLKFVPPQQEVQLLRDVLAMGTASSVLMKDIIGEQDKLQWKKKQVYEECLRSRNTLRQLRKELLTLKTYVKDLVRRRMPFMCYEEELLMTMNSYVQKEAFKVAQLWAETKEVHAMNDSGKFNALSVLPEAAQRKRSASLSHSSGCPYEYSYHSLEDDDEPTSQAANDHISAQRRDAGVASTVTYGMSPVRRDRQSDSDSAVAPPPWSDDGQGA